MSQFYPRLKFAFSAVLLLLLLVPTSRLSAQVFTDSNLPIVIITTDTDPNTGQPYEIPDDPRVPGNMKIIKRPDGTRNYITDQNTAAFLNYDGRIDIEVRGSTSQSLEKKPYGLTTRLADNVSNNNVSLLGMPSENDWVLNSLAFDESMVRDYLSYHLSRLMGNYAPRTQYCEVVVNGDYRGLYLLQEKIKADSNRVNVLKITTSDTSAPNITGGYITKSDKTTGGDPVAWYMTSYNGDTAFIHDLPKPEDVTPLQNTYIHGQFNSLQSTASANNISASNGFPSVIDIPSFVDFMISSEYASNVDSYQFSTYFHKDRAGKLRAGPIWDYNLTYGNDLGGMPGRSQFNVWQFDNGDNTGAKFWKDLFNNPTFKCYLSKRFHELTQPGQPLRHNNVVADIDQTVLLIAEAEARDDQRWNSVGNWSFQIDYLKTWLLSRINWMTANLGAFNTCSVSVPSLVINRINYNPGTSGSFPVSNDQEFIEIKNAGAVTVNLTGIYFSYLGISYTFPNGSTLGAGQSVFLASNTATFQSRYGFAAFGQFTRNLSNNSQRLILADAWGNVIDSVEYDDDAPWPNADGNGSYLQLVSTSLDNALASSWIATSASLDVPVYSVAGIQLFPNPVRDRVSVSGESMISGVRIFDLGARLVTASTPNSSAFEIDMSALKTGMYLVEITSGHGTATYKIVKQ